MFQKKPILQFHLPKLRGDGHCLVHSFPKRFNEATELVLGKCWHEMNDKWNHEHPENNVGVDFPNIIHLIKAGQHYDLLKQTIDVDDLPFNDEEKEESDCDCPKR